MDSSRLLSDPNVQTLSELLGEPITTSTGEARFESPFRHRFKDPSKKDTKRHLYVNPVKGKFICFKSGVAGSLSYLLSVLGAEMKESVIRDRSLDDLKSRIKSLGVVEPFQTPRAEVPDWAQVVRAGSEVHRYLRDRGVDDEDISHYRILEGTGNYQGWLVVPSYGVNGECEYWVSRDTRRKAYLNPPSNRRFHVAFLDQALAVSPRHVVVCEGVFSAIAAGRDAVATYGKLVTDSQVRKLASSGVEKVTLALDGDAFDETVETARKCLKMGMGVQVVPLPEDKDPADMSRGTFEILKKYCSVEVTESSLLKLRLLVSKI